MCRRLGYFFALAWATTLLWMGARVVSSARTLSQYSTRSCTTISIVHTKQLQQVPVRRGKMVPIVSKCGTCGTPSAIGKANSELHHFKQFPGMSYFEFKCPKCNEEELIFFMQDGRWTIGQALNMGLITHEGLEPTEDDIAYFEVACGVKFGAVTYNLGPTLTKEVDRFAEVLANTPDDVLLDLFSSPPAKSSLPKRWADK